jgi:hypothetical protein
MGVTDQKIVAAQRTRWAKLEGSKPALTPLREIRLTISIHRAWLAQGTGNGRPALSLWVLGRAPAKTQVADFMRVLGFVW